jgi:hypothetical protein
MAKPSLTSFDHPNEVMSHDRGSPRRAQVLETAPAKSKETFRFSSDSRRVCSPGGLEDREPSGTTYLFRARRPHVSEGSLRIILWET